MMSKSPQALLVAGALILVAYFVQQISGSVDSCADLWNTKIKRSDKRCKPLTGNDGLSNLPIFSAVYCFNNGSGVCKAFSGRFEFYFNPFEDKIIGPAPQSQFVDSFGYHSRMPVSYTISGQPLYADRSINWARKWAKQSNEGNSKLNLLDMNTFNWCGYTVNDYWPYKSSMRDPTGRYQIYFFNRQSCIYDNSTGKRIHYNTRFLHKSGLRIDLDPNPTIFALEDLLAKKKVLIKHRRQHYYEVNYEVQDYNGGLFILMTEFPEDDKNHLIVGARTLLTHEAYKNYTDVCVNDWHSQPSETEGATRNRRLVLGQCGVDGTEIADIPIVGGKDQLVLEVSLHGIPRTVLESQEMFRVKTSDDKVWEKFAADGLTYTAMTTFRPDSFEGKEAYQNTVKVIMIAAEYFVNPKDPKDEHYPEPVIFQYNTKKTLYRDGDYTWQNTSEIERRPFKFMNYPDDIAYLYRCKSILLVFGPLYQTLPADKFGPDVRARVDSIYDLGAYEPIAAFFADPSAGSNDLWLYHRMNWMTNVKYSCGNGPDGPVTAKPSGKYYPRAGDLLPPILHLKSVKLPYDYPSWSEEHFFKALGVYKGDTDRPEAPDPTKFPLGEVAPPEPAIESDNMWIYILIALAVLIIIAMCIICLVTTRRRRKRREQERLHSMTTNRSGMSKTNGSSLPSVRSGMHSGSSRAGRSIRSGMTSGGSRTGKSVRSGMKSGMTHSPTPSTRSALSNKNSSTRSPASTSSSNKLSSSRRSLMTSKQPSSSSSSALSSKINPRNKTTVRSKALSSKTSGASRK